MFTGTYDHNIDDKYRITFPARFREQLGERAVIFCWLDNNLVVMAPDRYKIFAEKVSSLNVADPAVRKFQRFLFANTCEFEFDKNGRFILPPNQRDWAHLEGVATVIGSGEKIEIWSPALLDQQNECFKDPNAASELASKFDLSL
jgi:MraZ protein